MYQYFCNDCSSYGQGYDDHATAARDGDAHQMETGHTNVEVHQAMSGGGYEVVDSPTG
jgi:hypothetical protein